ncbi:unnamed protein product [Schistosoma mattheei]|uniref:Superoxide dismutase copper/zinc binding domain-containing protein n=1 Tax=Schistosoma mattheei TaxID=31246 RepID=A0AA85BNK6_9TREM|nr:unnamed protein product [Schistosoma mattheei]
MYYHQTKSFFSQTTDKWITYNAAVHIYLVIYNKCKRIRKNSSMLQECLQYSQFYWSAVFGNVYFTKHGSSLTVTGYLSGFPRNKWLGVHIHEYGALGNECNDAGPHFNPFNSDHGGLTGSPRHPGDFGNHYVDQNGILTLDFDVDISSITKFNGFIGRSLVIHEKEDDLGRMDDDGSRKTGNSGKRLTCAVVGVWKAP